MRPRRLGTVLAVLAAAMVAPSPSQAVAPPPGAISANVEFVANIPELRTAIAVNFIGDTMFVSATTGVYSYDVTNPAAPKLLATLPMYIWENEDMDVDPVRKRIFISRDPRGFTSPVTPGATFPYGAVHIIDVSNPAALVQVGFFPLPAGHTSSCVNSCDYLWTGGPYANAQTQPGFTGRPIYATDVRDPLNPKPCPSPIDTGRNDGVTDYAHDVQVDAMGIAWVSGAGGVRGYRTSGRHVDPTTGAERDATACHPIPYAGGGTPNSATPSRFMHNAGRDLGVELDETTGNVLLGTEENITSNCASSGRFATYDLRGSYGGEGFTNIATTKFRMTALDTWTPEKQAGSTGCASAHYFQSRGDGLLAYAFYGQGTRFLDVSNPRDIRQVGYFRPDGASTWAAYWHKGYVYVADNARGVDILRFKDAPGGSPAAAPTVSAPALSAAAAAASPAARLQPSPSFGYLCPLPVTL